MTSTMTREFGKRLRDLRLSRGLTLKQLSDRTGLALNSIGRYERGYRNPRAENLEIIARGLNVSPAELLGGDGHGFSAPSIEAALYYQLGACLEGLDELREELADIRRQLNNRKRRSEASGNEGQEGQKEEQR